jgi:hypothetical protein
MKKKKADGGSPSSEDPLAPAGEHLLRQLMGSMGTAHSSTQTSLSVAVKRLTDIEPKGSVETMLAMQMIGAHEAAMECLRQAMLLDQTLVGRDLNLKHAGRLLSVFERQVAALDRHRGGGQQNVTVKYVHVAEGGQAIVGNVTRNGAAAVPKAEAPPAALRAPSEVPLEMPPVRQKVRAR